METISRKISEISAYEKNAKKHPRSQVDKIANSIKNFGFLQPIVVDKSGVVIVGHGRLEAAKLLGLQDVPTITVDLPEEKAKAYRLADNKLNESGWDMELVIEELKEISQEMIELTGFDKDLILDTDDKDDQMPAIPEITKSKLGDIYTLGGHRLLCGDSTDKKTVEKLMSGKRADLWLTDPPYNVSYTGKTEDAMTIENDQMNDDHFLEFLTTAFTIAKDVIKEGGGFYIWHADLEGYNFRKAVKDAGLTIRQCIIWVKNTIVMGRQDYQWRHEPCLYGWREGGPHNWYGDRDKPTTLKIPEHDEDALRWLRRRLADQEEKETSIINHDRPSRSSDHPTMKPIELFARLIMNSSKRGDLILDTFAGSGTTIIAAEKYERICYAMELDPKYVDVIVQRYVDYVDDENIILNGKKILWPKSQKAKE